MSSRALCSLLAFLVALALSTTVARAQSVQEIELPPSEMAAQGHYLMGLEHYRAGRFTEAAAEFTEAHELSGRPELLFNLYVARRDAGEMQAAADALRAYLEAAPDVSNAELLRARLANMDARLQAEAREAEQAEQAEQAEAAVAEIEPEIEPTPPEPQVEPEGVSPWPWVVAGGGAALFIGAAITGGLALSMNDELRAMCPDQRCPSGFDFEGRASTGEALAITTDVLGAIGIVALGVGLVWAIVDATSGGASSEDEQVALRCGPAGCAVRF